MRRSKDLIRTIATVMAFAIAFGAGNAAATDRARAADKDRLVLERVVMLFRHGVRAPLEGEVGTAGRARQPWPTWSTPGSLLTPHGREGMRLLGAYDRQWLVAAGLLPREGCPVAGSVRIRTNTEQRTIASGQALAAGLAPGCTLAPVHPAPDSEDPLFHPIEAGAVQFDAVAAVQAVLAQTGGPEVLAAPYGDAMRTMEAVLGCRGKPCDIARVPAALTPAADGRGMQLSGPIQITSGTAQVFLLQYAEGLPLSQVGWGRASRQRITEMSRLHALLFDIYARPDYMAKRIGGPLVHEMFADIDRPKGPRLTMLVASDNNIAALSSLMGVHFHIDSYGKDDPPPGGALGVQVLRDLRSGVRYVKVFYQAQTLDQLRALTPLTLAHPPVWQTLAVPGCVRPHGQRCRLDDFRRLLDRRAAIAPAVTISDASRRSGGEGG